MNEEQAQQQLRLTIRRKGLAYRTEKNYAGWLVRYMAFLRESKPTGDSAKKMECFLSALAKDRNISPSTQNQAFNAIRFFYTEVLHQRLGNINALRAKPRKHVRHAPSEADTRRLLAEIRDRNGFPIRLICHLLYGCGLRVSEPLNLRVKDVDIERRRLIIREAKGGKDRVVEFPECLESQLVAQLNVARAVWERDRHSKIPVQLPDGIGRKYPAAKYSWGWAFVFPGHNPVKHPRTGEIARYHLHEANIQRAVREAAATTGMEGVISPHILRHAYATHAMRRGAYVRDVQHVMGHESLETTMGYLHAEAGRVPSPLEEVA